MNINKCNPNSSKGYGVIEILLCLSLLSLACFAGIYARNCKDSEEDYLNIQNFSNSCNYADVNNSNENPSNPDKNNSYVPKTDSEILKDSGSVDLINKLKFSCDIELNDKTVEVTLNFKNISDYEVEDFYVSNIFLGDSTKSISSSLCNRKINIKDKYYVTFPISINEYNSLNLKGKNYCSLIFTISNENMSNIVNLDRVILPI